MICYDSVLQNATDAITKCDSYFITKRDRSLLKNESGFLFQNATFITNCDKTLVSGRGHDAKRIYFLMSSVIYRGDQDFEDFNRNLENFCKGKYVRFISNNNNDDVCLNRSWLHLKNGTTLLVKNFSKVIN